MTHASENAVLLPELLALETGAESVFGSAATDLTLTAAFTLLGACQSDTRLKAGVARPTAILTRGLPGEFPSGELGSESRRLGCRCRLLGCFISTAPEVSNGRPGGLSGDPWEAHMLCPLGSGQRVWPFHAW